MRLSTGLSSRLSRSRKGGPGSAHDWLHDEKRRAVEIVEEGKAAARRPDVRDEAGDVLTPQP
jgi:hypothetical protein